MSDTETTMPPLFPEIPPDREAVVMRLEEFPPDALLLSPEVDQGLVESIQEWGLQQPIVASPVDPKTGEREVYAGNRRIKATRRLGWVEIAGFELTQDPNSTVDPHVLAEQLNSTAKPNPIVQLEAIEILLGKGYSDKQVSKALKLKLGTVRARMRLKELHPKLREGVKRNKISFGNADRIAKMSEATQQRLADRFVADGKLPWSVIDEERRKKVDDVTESFDLDIENLPGWEDVGGSDPEATASGEQQQPVLDDKEQARLEAKVWDVLDTGKKASFTKRDAESVAKLMGLR